MLTQSCYFLIQQHSQNKHLTQHLSCPTSTQKFDFPSLQYLNCKNLYKTQLNRTALPLLSLRGEKVEVMLYDLAGFYIDSYSSNIGGLGNQISEWRWDTKDVESGVYFANVVVSGNNKTESALIKIAVID